MIDIMKEYRTNAVEHKQGYLRSRFECMIKEQVVLGQRREVSDSVATLVE